MSNDKRKTTTIDAKHKFTPEEKVELSEQMARYTQMRREAEDAKKASASQYKSQIEEYDARLNGISERINQGYEMRSTKCFVDFNYETKTKFYYSVKTGELVDQRPMSENDFQTEMEVVNE